MTTARNVLAVNVGSTSLKYAVFATETDVVCRGRAARIASAGSALVHDGPDGRVERPLAAPGLDAALDAMVHALGPSIDGVACVAFKVVHGGDLTGTVLMDDRAVAALRRFAAAAPAHNPPYIAAIERIRELLPGVPLVGTFETAFHAGWPPEARAYAVPQGWAERYGLRRYGFHGASHRYISERLAALAPDARRVLSCHLGGSSSVCAVVDGRSVDATMGFSPQSGLPQAERVGDLDAFAIAHLASEGVSHQDAVRALATRGGLLGVSGLSGDLRDLEAAEDRGDERAAFALSLFAYETRKAIGALAAAMAGLDAVAFTGGVGEHSGRLRARICEGLAFVGVRLDPARNADARGQTRIDDGGDGVAVWVLPTDEEAILVREALAFLHADR